MRHAELRNRICQRPGCGKRVSGTARFCSAKCRTADYRDSHSNGSQQVCPNCGAALRRGRGRPRKSDQVQQAKEATR
jgi:endogenous inhibitor of DNA gyrase (YacG/DUF329 family)